MAKTKMEVFQLTDGTWLAGDAFIEVVGSTREEAVKLSKARIKDLKGAK
jgi:hypothetical protein